MLLRLQAAIAAICLATLATAGLTGAPISASLTSVKIADRLPSAAPCALATDDAVAACDALNGTVIEERADGLSILTRVRAN
ncbi:MAG: hypothetical protein U1E56_05035 [Bauldia sp.]